MGTMEESEVLEQLQVILQAIDQSRQETKTLISESEQRTRALISESEQRTRALISESEQRTKALISGSETRVKVFVENTVTKRIDALFDGYKLTHEKQWELERRTEALQGQLQELQERLSALEHKIA